MSVFHTNIQEIEIEIYFWRFSLQYSQFFSCYDTESKKVPFHKTQEMVSKVKKDGLEKEPDFVVREASSVYKVCVKYLLKWTVSFNEFYCFNWINLNDALSSSDVQSTIK
jgi:hypothetical protein